MDDYHDRLNNALKENAALQSSIGIDSSKAEIDLIKRKQYQNLLFLKEIDPDKFELLTKDSKKYRSFQESTQEI